MKLAKLYQEKPIKEKENNNNDFICSNDLHGQKKNSVEEQLCEDWNRATITIYLIQYWQTIIKIIFYWGEHKALNSEKKKEI